MGALEQPAMLQTHFRFWWLFFHWYQRNILKPSFLCLRQLFPPTQSANSVPSYCVRSKTNLKFVHIKLLIYRLLKSEDKVHLSGWSGEESDDQEYCFWPLLFPETVDTFLSFRFKRINVIKTYLLDHCTYIVRFYAFMKSLPLSLF